MSRPHRIVLAVGALAVALISASGPSAAGSTQRATASSLATASAECMSAATFCSPDGNIVIELNGEPGCSWSAAITWGDNTPTEVINFVGTQQVSHHYTDPSVYTSTVSVSGSSPDPNTQCVGSSSGATIEVPFEPAQLDLLAQIEAAARDYLKDFKQFKNTNKHKPSARLTIRTKRLVVDAKLAKPFIPQWKQQGLPPSGSGQVALGKGQLSEYFGWLESLKKLAHYPEVQREAADDYYKTDEGKARMDFLAGHQFNGKNYSQLNADGKQKIASQVQTFDGAIRVALRSAQKAGRAGLEMIYAQPK